MNARTLEEMYTELAALKLEIYLTKLEKKLAEKAETVESEVAKVWCYWNGEVVDCAELSKRLLIGKGCESDSDLSVSTSPSASETLAPSSLAQDDGHMTDAETLKSWGFEEMPDKQYVGDILSQALSTSPSASETVWEQSESKEDITLFFNRCANFDWFYSYSDDSNVWRRGEKNFKQLKEDSTQSPVFEKIFTDWREYNFNGESWGTQKPAKPEIASYI